MGKIVSHTTYEYYEYVTAILISIGMTLFMLDSSDHKNGNTSLSVQYILVAIDIITNLQILSDGATTLSGVILLGGYLLLDSFTSTWQNALFIDYGVTSVQMMCAVNMFSCLLTAMSLFQQSSFPLIFSFMATVINLQYVLVFYNIVCTKVALTTFIIQYPRFIIDCLLISICSASGQLYIFYTISKFGSITFVIMMTIRQVYNYLILICKKKELHPKDNPECK